MFKSRDIYIDLGTSNTLIYIKDIGLIANEPTLVAKKNAGRFNEQIISQGRSAKMMLGKVPEHMSVSNPLHEGVIANLDLAIKMVSNFLKPYKQRYFWNKPRMLISLPCEVTAHERNAIIDLGHAAGAGRVDLIEEPLAAAVGMGVDVLESNGQMVVDIGGGTTEALILSLGGIVSCTAFREGGESLNKAIVDHLRLNYNFLIGELTAEKLKIELSVLNQSKILATADSRLGSERTLALDSPLDSSLDTPLIGLKNSSTVISGIDLASGLPSRKVITSEMIAKPIESFVARIVLTIKSVLKDCPPELSSDIKDNGIILAGGGANLKGLGARITAEFDLPTLSSDNPLVDVFNGGKKLIEHPNLFDKLKLGA